MDEKAREGERAREMCDTSSVSVGHVDTFCRLAADAEQETVDRFDETHTARMKTVLSLTQIRVTLTARSSLAPPTTLHTTLTTTTPHDPHHHQQHSTRPSPPTLHTTLTTNTPHDPHHSLSVCLSLNRHYAHNVQLSDVCMCTSGAVHTLCFAWKFSRIKLYSFIHAYNSVYK